MFGERESVHVLTQREREEEDKKVLDER